MFTRLCSTRVADLMFTRLCSTRVAGTTITLSHSATSGRYRLRVRGGHFDGRPVTYDSFKEAFKAYDDIVLALLPQGR